MLRQIGVEGIVTALHDVPNGEIWTEAAIADLRMYIEEHGLRWSVVESLPVCEAIKYAGPEREQLIENYKVSLANLGKQGVRTVCYNFMPVIDWIRTDLEHPWPDGSSSLYFDRVRFAYFDLRILEREGAEADYSPEELEKVAELDKVITEAEKAELVDAIIVKTQGFVNGNIKESDKNPVNLFKQLLAKYEGIDRATLRENMRYFLAAVMPVCEEYGVNMCVHPDDPPFQVLGLPRIVTDEADIDWFLHAVDNPHNGLTFCAGSLSAGTHNDTRELARKFASRTHFVHLRSTDAMPGGNFIESSHLTGRGHLIDLIRVFERERPDLPMRVDHGRMMLGDEDKGYNPGYSFHGRMLALAQVEGMIAVVDDEMRK
jgi:mannonate dehydratase